MANCLIHGLIALVVLCAVPVAVRCETGLEELSHSLQSGGQLQTGANSDSQLTGQEKTQSGLQITNDSILLSPQDTKLSTQDENADESNIMNRNGMETDRQNAAGEEVPLASGLTQAPAPTHKMKSDLKSPVSDAEKTAGMRLLGLIKNVSLESSEQREELRQNISDALGLSPLEPAKAMLPLGFGNPNPSSPSVPLTQLREEQDEADEVKTETAGSRVLQPQTGSDLQQNPSSQDSQSDSYQKLQSPFSQDVDDGAAESGLQQNVQALQPKKSGSEKAPSSDLTPDKGTENSQLGQTKNGLVIPQDSQAGSELQPLLPLKTKVENEQETEEQEDPAEDINIGNPPSAVDSNPQSSSTQTAEYNRVPTDKDYDSYEDVDGKKDDTFVAEEGVKNSRDGYIYDEDKGYNEKDYEDEEDENGDDVISDEAKLYDSKVQATNVRDNADDSKKLLDDEKSQPADVEGTDKKDDYGDDDFADEDDDDDYGDDDFADEDDDDEYSDDAYEDNEYDDQDDNDRASTVRPAQTHFFENGDQVFGDEENKNWGKDEGFGLGGARTTDLQNVNTESKDDDYKFGNNVPSWLKNDYDDVDVDNQGNEEDDDDDWYYKQNFDEENSTPTSTTTRPYPEEPLEQTENRTKVVSTQIKAPEFKEGVIAVEEPTVPKKALPGPKGSIILYTVLIICFIAGIVVFSIWKNPFKNMRPSHATPVVRTGEEGKRLLDHPFV